MCALFKTNMVQAIDEAYRQSEQYIGWWTTAQQKFPGLSQSLFDHALACHLGNPKAWRDKKRFPHNPSKPQPPSDFTIDSVTVEPPKEPSSSVEPVEDQPHGPVGQATVTEEVAVTVADVDDHAPAPDLS